MSKRASRGRLLGVLGLGAATFGVVGALQATADAAPPRPARARIPVTTEVCPDLDLASMASFVPKARDRVVESVQRAFRPVFDWFRGRPTDDRLPAPKEPYKWCDSPAKCIADQICLPKDKQSPSRYSNVDLVKQRIHDETLLAPEVVFAPEAIQEEFRKAGCTPNTPGNVRERSTNCGIIFNNNDNQYAPRAMVRALARLAKEYTTINAANGTRYVVFVESLYRTIEWQAERVCKKHATIPNYVCGNDLACPGPSSLHTNGVSVDLHIRSLPSHTKETFPVSKAKPASQTLREVRASPHATLLNHIMFRHGWWRLATEHWHFEYTRTDANAVRTNCLDDSDCGGKRCVPRGSGSEASSILICK